MVSQIRQGEAEERLCSLVARQSGEDPIGTAPSYDEYLMIEVSLPWPKEALDAKGGAPGLLEAIKEAETLRPRLRVQAIVPADESESVERLRVLHYRRPADQPFADMARQEFTVAPSQVGTLILAIARGEAIGEDVAERMTVDPDVRDLFVCTHGTRDTCCGQFGYPLFATVRERYVAKSEGRLRVWRSNHLGGHRFAPTLLDLPSGRYWGFVDEEILDTLLLQTGPVAQLREHYRGLGALQRPMEQVVEREAFIHFGWEWLNAEKSIRTVLHDEAAGKSVVELSVRLPDSSDEQVWEGVVELAGTVRTLTNSNSDEWIDAPQYRVTRFELRS